MRSRPINEKAYDYCIELEETLLPVAIAMSVWPGLWRVMRWRYAMKVDEYPDRNDWIVGSFTHAGMVIIAMIFGFTLSGNTDILLVYLLLVLICAIDAWVMQTRKIRRMRREMAARRLVEGV